LTVKSGGIRRRISLLRALVIIAVGSLLLIFPLLWLRVMRDPAQRTAADFLPFYAAGRIAITEGMSKVYDLEAERRAEDDVLNSTLIQYYASQGRTVTPQDLGPALKPNEVNPFPHPPFILPILAVLARLDYVPAFVLWSLLMTVLFIASAVVLLRQFPQAARADRWTLFFGSVLFFPAFFSLINGQDTGILFLGAVLWYIGLVQEDDRLAGLGLALTAIRPQLALAYSLPFLFKRRKVWWWFCLGAGLLAVFSLVLLGRTGTVNYLHILTLSASGSGYTFINDTFHIDLTGLLPRTFPWMATSLVRTIAWIGYGVAMIFLIVVWARSARIEEKNIGLAVLVSVVFVPHFNYHDLVILLVPLYGILRALIGRKLTTVESAVMLPLGVTILLFITYFFLPALKYPILYPLMALIVLALWFPEKIVFWRRKADLEVQA
jgi:hypothetical protein